MFELRVRGGFAAAHRLREYDGNCERLHGHNWQVEVEVAAAETDGLGMVIDFRDLKRHLRDALAAFDHQYLNELPSFRDRNPSTEHLAREVYGALAARLPAGVSLRAVTVWEAADTSATYRPD